MAFAEIAPDEEVLPLSPGEFPVSYAGPAGTTPKKKERYAEIGPDEEVLPLQPPSLLERGVSAVKAIPSLLPKLPPSTPITTPPATMAGTPLATPPTPMGGGIDIGAAAPVVDKVATSVAKQTGKPPAAPPHPPRPRPAFEVDPRINERAEAQKQYLSSILPRAPRGIEMIPFPNVARAILNPEAIPPEQREPGAL